MKAKFLEAYIFHMILKFVTKVGKIAKYREKIEKVSDICPKSLSKIIRYIDSIARNVMVRNFW